MRTLVWFRNDLRVGDNPALYHAAERGSVVALFLVAHTQWRAHDVGDRRVAFVLDNLARLQEQLARYRIPLLVAVAPRFQDAPQAVLEAAQQVSAGRVAFNEEYPLNEKVRDSRVARVCRAAGLAVDVHHAGTVLPPGSVLTQNNEPYTVFSPFKRRWLANLMPTDLEPLPPPARQPETGVSSSPLPDTIDGVTREAVRGTWPGGEAEAERRLAAFLATRVERYQLQRDLPAVSGTSTLSPYLSVGAISARRCVTAAAELNGGRLTEGNAGIAAWISELVWRDFYRHVIALFPHVSQGQAFKRDTDRLPWRTDRDDLEAWQQGRTGYPLVDAAMRQLNATGWMHNRLRMVSAMFLTKHLLLDWRLGERYFMQQLVDGDFASNNGGWQWSASTGTDAAPYFRIFNPTSQAKKFDPHGEFVRRYVPELAGCSAREIFEPDVAGYPAPIVEHRFARQRALDFYRQGA